MSIQLIHGKITTIESPGDLGFSCIYERVVSWVSAESDVHELRKELTQLLSRPCFDDIMIFMLASNVKDGKVWANYECFKHFFSELRYGTYGDLSGLSRDVRNVILNLMLVPEIDHSMTRIMGLSGLFSYTCNAGDDCLYMDEAQRTSALQDHGNRMSTDDLSSMVEIARRYGLYLESIGR